MFVIKDKKWYSKKERNLSGERMNYNFINIKEPLLNWYRVNHRDLKWRKTKDPFQVWISEIMLQQTRVEAVKGYYDRFLSEIPDVKTLAYVSEEKLLKLWEGLGYYNRARNLQKAAKTIMDEYCGDFPNRYDEVIKLSGIGEYTAGAICSICFDEPTPAIDGNVLRVMMRLSDCYDNIDDLKTKRMVKDMLLPLYKTGECSELTQSLMELGAVVCVPNGAPKCTSCPLKELCKAYEKSTFSMLPVRKEKKKEELRRKQYLYFMMEINMELEKEIVKVFSLIFGSFIMQIRDWMQRRLFSISVKKDFVRL